FVLTICEELGIFVRDEDTDSIKDLVDILNKRLLEAHAKGRRIVVIVDEAQNLTPETLEQVRLLTNLETASHKLLQIILIGQPELREVLARVELRQLAQRITGRYHVAPLSKTETAAYVRHRLKVAGTNGEVFTPAALREAHRLSDGIPRIINVICDRALLGAVTQEQHRIGPNLIRAAASEVYGRPFNPPWLRLLVTSSAAIGVAVLAFAVWLLVDTYRGASSPPALVAAEPAPPAQPITLAESTPVSVDVGVAEHDIDSILETHVGETNTEAAFAQLFSLWGGRFDPASGRPCDQAVAQRLERS